MTTDSFVFIYAKDGMLKALPFEKAKTIGVSLLEDGWIHTATLDPCVWIEYLYSLKDPDDILAEVIELGIKVK